MLFWLLLVALLLLCLFALGLTLLTLWRRVKDLGRQVSVVGDTMSEASEALNALQAGGARSASACPTCGAPASAAVPAGARQAPAPLVRA